MNNLDSQSISKALLFVCWYLDRGPSFSVGMRRETLAGVIDLLSDLSKEGSLSLKLAQKSLAEEYPNQELRMDLTNSLDRFLKQLEAGNPTEEKIS